MAKVTRTISNYFSELGKRSHGGGRKEIPANKRTEQQKKNRARYERTAEFNARQLRKILRDNEKK